MVYLFGGGTGELAMHRLENQNHCFTKYYGGQKKHSSCFLAHTCVCDEPKYPPLIPWTFLFQHTHCIHIHWHNSVIVKASCTSFPM